MEKILNMTQHSATEEQLAVGVIDPPAEYRGLMRALLTFDTAPDAAEIRLRAEELADIFRALRGSLGVTRAMIGGAPFFMGALEAALGGTPTAAGVIPVAVYAFSRRESVEETLADGSVRKVAVFRHAGFVAGTVAQALTDAWYDGNR